ncbi:MAG TPA: adenosylcobinamide-GDP ribazoletransferase [Stellaceae bacterium]|nr:adenosylcobinamide-GDP ribazoletransferase [Stellaceae bacterium]
MVAGFAIAVAFLTRIPLGRPGDVGQPLAAAAWAFPLVGAGIGAIAGFVYLAAELLGLGDGPAALLAVLAGLWLTGALHEDGLADSADGLFGGGDRPARLAIMRDSRHGTYGVLALVVSVALRAAALAHTGEAVYAGLALIAAHAVSRALLPVVMRLLAPARADGLAVEAGRPGLASVAAAVLIGLLITAAALGPVLGAIAFAVAAATGAAGAVLARRRIGGYTGDVLGAVQQLGEITMLLAAATR